ncbi:probable disease resistance protein At4g27220 isoform X2 [Cornus florida]|uniref:probable disease resistance protein At4g27220 isoform X2 n=1 Tax=Cornus florida TaxID=4283 RepID=UPI00289BE125|nr:probable disease resistance protein At4g27220 isoform X2 [Cornus florida]
MAGEILTSIGIKIGEYLVEPTKRQLRYMICFNSIVEDLRKENETLKLMQHKVHNLVEVAKRNVEEIEKDVQEWLKDVDGITMEVPSLEDEIRVNKSCITGWCPNCSRRYRLGKKLTKKTTIIIGLQEKGNFNSVSHNAAPPGIELLSSGDFMAFESTKSAFIQIMEALKDDKTNIIGVHGMGGLGKTMLVKEVGKKAKQLKLFDQVVMAVVSQTIKIKEIQGQIADMLGLKFDQESETGRAGRLCMRLKNEKKVLIILDDVWEHLNLTEIGIPFGNDHRGCKIVLTSRRQQVYTSMGVEWKIPLNIISEEETQVLLKKNAGLGDNIPTLNAVATQVAKECQGLPIAIVTVGRALRGKSLDEWEEAAQQLRVSQPVDIEGVDKKVYKCLELSYDYLVSKETKWCFLFCSLFPEDYVIDLEDLCRYMGGQGLFKDVDTIEKSRRKVRTITNNLKASGLLLSHDGEQYVRMHDVVRDVALQIASKEKHMFMVRAGSTLKKWPEQERFDRCTVISLMANELHELPDGLNCPKLDTLLLGRNKACVNIPASFFEGMKGLRVLDLSHSRGFCGEINIVQQVERPKMQVTLSLPPSLELLTNLRTLYLCDQVLGNISILGKLRKLEFLCFCNCEIHELPNEIGELSNLRLLDLTDCYALEMIPAYVISRLLKLEELYIGGKNFRRWEVESTSKERSNASLSELISLPHLKNVAVVMEDVLCLPKDFHFRNFTRYNIGIGCESGGYPNSNSLQLEYVHSALPSAIKELLSRTEYLSFTSLEEGSRNIIPNIDQEGLKELKCLKLHCCDEIECLIDTTKWKQQIAFPNVAELHLDGMECMRVICCGRLPVGFLQKLRVFVATQCRNLCDIVPVLGSPLLEKVEIGHCNKIQHVFQLGEEFLFKEENIPFLSNLKELKLSYLSELQCIWKGPTHLVYLHNLEVLKVRDCKGLRNFFPLPIARSLIQLKILEIRMCQELEQIIADVDHEMNLSAADQCQAEAASFPHLQILTVEGCDKLNSLFSVTIARSLRHLKELKVVGASELEELFSEEIEADIRYRTEIVLPELSYLELRKLPRFTRVCSGSYHFIWPHMKELQVEDLPGMTTDATANLLCTTVSKGKDLAPNFCNKERPSHQGS